MREQGSTTGDVAGVAAPRLILWDVDGTLLRSKGASVRAYLRALRAVYQLEGELARVTMHGKTDGQIALELLAHHDHTEEQALELLDRFREAYVAELEAARSELAADLVVLPGVRDVLERLRARGVRQSLLTGNFEAAARVKLGCAGLDRYVDFAIGAFGSDHRDRNSLVPIALEKARRLRGDALGPADVVVVGDTPRDVACARAGGARAVAVATGQFAADELARHAPDALLPDLRDAESAVSAILAGSYPVSRDVTG